MKWSEVTAPTTPETVIGYSLFGGLVYLTVMILRRTRDIDRRRDRLAQTEMELAQAREQVASSDRARLQSEIERLRSEMWKIRFALDARLSEENHHVDE
jgi:hypothetical protein